jgi:hypothetical protein
VSEATAGERALAERLGLDPSTLAAARDALNTIASLPWPQPERVSLIVRVARSAKADVGTLYAGRALDAAPLSGFDALLPLPGLGDKRVAGLARALSTFDVKDLSSEGARLRDAWAAMEALRAENHALRVELDRLRVRVPAEAAGGPVPVPAPSTSTVMRVADVAANVGTQVTLAETVLRSRPDGLRLDGLDIRLHGVGTAADGDVALDLGSPLGGSSLGIAFVPAKSPAPVTTDIPVPDVSGYTTALAQRKLIARGFMVTVASVAGGGGIVSEQLPAASTLAPSGSVVRLIVR